jgi:hypothetical protein
MRRQEGDMETLGNGERNRCVQETDRKIGLKFKNSSDFLFRNGPFLNLGRGGTKLVAIRLSGFRLLGKIMFELHFDLTLYEPSASVSRSQDLGSLKNRYR